MVLYFTYLIDTKEESEALLLFKQTLSQYDQVGNLPLITQIGSTKIKEFKEAFDNIIQRNPSEIIVLPIFLVGTDKWPTVLKSLAEILNMLSSYTATGPTIHFSPLLFAKIENYPEISDGLKSLTIPSGIFYQVFLISDKFCNGLDAMPIDWAMLLELLLETIVTLEQSGGFLRQNFLRLNPVATFGFKILEVPIRKIAKEEAVENWRGFAREQIQEENGLLNLDATTEVKQIVNELQNMEIGSKKEYNPYEERSFEEFEFLVPDELQNLAKKCHIWYKDFFLLFKSLSLTPEETKNLEEKLGPHAQDEISKALNNAFTEATSKITTFYSNRKEDILRNRVNKYQNSITDTIAKFFKAGGTLKTFESSIDKNLEKLRNWQADIAKTPTPPLSVDELNTDEEKTSFVRYLKALVLATKNWLDKKSPKLYLLPFLLILVVFTGVSMFVGFRYLRLPFTLKTTASLELISVVMASIVTILIRAFILHRLAKISQEKLQQVGEELNRIQRHFLKTISEAYLRYTSGHIAVKVSSLLNNALQAMQSTTKVFRVVFERKTPEFSTISDSRLVINKEVSDSERERIKDEIRSILPRWHEQIYSDFINILSPKELQDHISAVICGLENRALRLLRERFPLNETDLRNHINNLDEGSRDLIPLPLVPDFIPAQEFSCFCKVSTIPIDADNAQIHPLDWQRSESAMVGVFYGNIELENIKCKKELNK